MFAIRDNYQGASEFFHFEHSASHRGTERAWIDELWVPAGILTEEDLSDDEAILIQEEARYRLLQGRNIRVFSRPERLAVWLAENGLTISDREHLFTDAGTTVPDYSLGGEEKVEFFIHSPLARRLDDGGVEDRNGDCLVFQARFESDGAISDVMFSGDSKHETWKDIVEITRWKGNDRPPYSRLHWDVYKLPHHCSYTAIGPEKSPAESPDKTLPTEWVRALCEDHGGERCIIVSPSDPIPMKGSKEDKNVQPPHREAATYYKDDVVLPKVGRFVVTMSHPEGASQPQPVVVELGSRGATLCLTGASAGAAAVVSTASPRAGHRL